MTYTGTASDRDLLLTEGLLDATDDFQVVDAPNIRIPTWAIRKASYRGWWDGFDVGCAHAVTAATTRRSFLSRLLRRS